MRTRTVHRLWLLVPVAIVGVAMGVPHYTPGGDYTYEVPLPAHPPAAPTLPATVTIPDPAPIMDGSVMQQAERLIHEHGTP